jgi:hypothetical protein
MGTRIRLATAALAVAVAGLITAGVPALTGARSGDQLNAQDRLQVCLRDQDCDQSCVMLLDQVRDQDRLYAGASDGDRDRDRDRDQDRLYAGASDGDRDRDRDRDRDGSCLTTTATDRSGVGPAEDQALSPVRDRARTRVQDRDESQAQEQERERERQREQEQQVQDQEQEQRGGRT